MPRLILKIKPNKGEGEAFQEKVIFESEVQPTYRSIIEALKSYNEKIIENFTKLADKNDVTLETALKSEIQFNNNNK